MSSLLLSKLSSFYRQFFCPHCLSLKLCLDDTILDTYDTSPLNIVNTTSFLSGGHANIKTMQSDQRS